MCGQMLQGVESVTIIRKASSGVDDYGLPIRTSTQIVVPNVLVGFDSTGEPVSESKDSQNVSVKLFFPHGTVIHPADEFLIRGERFVKDGRAMDWVSPMHGLDVGVVVNVRQTLG